MRLVLPALALGLVASSGCRGPAAPPTCDTPSACEQVCSADTVELCFDAGRMYAAGIKGPRNPKRAAELFDHGCKLGHAPSCTFLGSAYEQGVGRSVSRDRALSLYERACEAGDGRGCVGLGLMLELEKPALSKLMLERGLEQLELSCSAAAGPDCTALASLYAQGIGVTTEPARARAYYSQACAAERGDPEACFALADYVRLEDPQAGEQLRAQACEGGYLYACVQLGVELVLDTGPTAHPAEGVIYLRSACDLGEPHACTTLGSIYASGVGVSVDAGRAVLFYERGCTAEDARACGSLGLMYSLGEGVTVNLARAGGLFAQACELGDAGACGNLGWMRLRGIHYAADPSGAALLEQACAESDGRSCYRYGLHVAEQSTELDALGIWRRGCELGSSQACTALSVSLIDNDDGGSGEQQGLAIELARYGCQEGSAAGCTLAGQIFALGWNVERDREVAEAYLNYACELGDGDGCEVLATWYSHEDQDAERTAGLWARGRALRERECESGRHEDCVVLGAYYLRGLGVDKDPARAAELYGRACSGGLNSACTQRAQLLVTGTGVEPAYDEAFGLFSQACEGGDRLACAWLGVAYHRGRGVEADAEQALRRYGEGCDEGFAVGCIGMGKLHEQGFGVSKSERKAKGFFTRACELGATRYCD